MTVRRDFLAITAVAVVAKTVLLVGAKAEEVNQAAPPPRPEGEGEFVSIFARLTEQWAEAPVASHPDADLLNACATFDMLERAYLANGFAHDPLTLKGVAIEAEQDRIQREQHPLVDSMCEMRAVTMEGQAARARSLALWDAELMKPQGDITGQFTQAIVRDLLAGSAGA